MGDPDQIIFMSAFLKDFNYPLIHSMNSEEMANVFHISNRCFLVNWTLKLMDVCYVDILGGREHDTDLLGMLVHHHGFCTAQEQNGFFNGDLPISRQVQILHRMFKCVERLKKAPLIEKPVTVTLENLQSMMHKNLNIFPSLGEIKTLSKKEKLLEINRLKKEIEQLSLLEPIKIDDHHIVEKSIPVDRNEMGTVVEQLVENFSKFERIVRNLSKENNSEVKCNYKVDSNFEDILMKCNDYLKVVSQYIEDLRIINNFTIVEVPQSCDEITSLVEILAEQIRNTKFIS